MSPYRLIFVFFCCIVLVQSVAFAEVRFEDITDSSGLGGYRELGYGAAFLDYNSDGFQDIFIVGQEGLHRLYKNNGDLTFDDVTHSLNIRGRGAGWGVCYGDFDSDYDEDIYISRRDYIANDLYVFNGFTFDEMALDFQVADSSGFGYSACFAPLSKGLSLDLVLTNQAWPNGRRQSCRFFAGHVGQPFQNLTEEAGLADSTQYWDCVATADYDNDGDLDLLVAGEPANQLYNNNGVGGFTNVSDSAGINLPVDGDTTGYGIAWGDYDNDGWMDVYIGYWHDQYSELFHNNGDGTFTDITDQAAVGYETWTHTVVNGDFDNDGWLDLYAVTGGHGSKLYMNNHNGAFTEYTDSAGVRDDLWCCGSTVGDIDNDGKLDIVNAHYADGAPYLNKSFLFHNITENDNNWIVIRVNGVPPNPDAIGARVLIGAGGLQQIREVSGGAGFGSQNMLPVHFGIGLANIVDSVVITFPNLDIPPFVRYNLSPNRQYVLPDIVLDIAAVGAMGLDTLMDCGQPISPSIKVANIGNTDVGAFLVYCLLDRGGVNIVRDSMTIAALGIGDTLVMDFGAYGIPQCRQQYRLTGFVKLLGDRIRSNDTTQVGFFAAFSNDLACGPIISPNPDSLESPLLPRVEITNMGISSLSEFPVSCQVTFADTIVYSELTTYDDTLRFGDDDLVIFPEFQPLYDGQYRFAFRNEIDGDDNSANDTVSILVNLVVAAVSDEGGLPIAFQLYQNYPNPFNANTAISFDMPRADRVTLSLYNLSGQKVADLYDGWMAAGRQTLRFEIPGLASGIYIYRMESHDKTFSRKMILLK